MTFIAKNGKRYYEELLSPPKEIDCHCGKKLIDTGYRKPMAPPLIVYKCECGYEVSVGCEYTKEHWPQEIQEEEREWHKRWVAAGSPITEGIGTMINTGKGIAVVKVDSPDLIPWPKG